MYSEKFKQAQITKLVKYCCQQPRTKVTGLQA